MTAVDYSFARYTVAQLKAAGVTAVGRYLNGTGKAISEIELAGLLFGGIKVWLAFENTATDASGGYGVGAQYATEANVLLAALGLPSSTPVYFAADTEYLHPADAIPYYQGLASNRSPASNGCYGEGDLIELAFNEGLIGFGWESESSSFPGSQTASPHSAIWQQVGTLGGIAPWWDGAGWGYKIAVHTTSPGQFTYYRFPSNGSAKAVGAHVSTVTDHPAALEAARDESKWEPEAGTEEAA